MDATAIRSIPQRSPEVAVLGGASDEYSERRVREGMLWIASLNTRRNETLIVPLRGTPHPVARLRVAIHGVHTSSIANEERAKGCGVPRTNSNRVVSRKICSATPRTVRRTHRPGLLAGG